MTFLNRNVRIPKMLLQMMGKLKSARILICPVGCTFGEWRQLRIESSDIFRKIDFNVNKILALDCKCFFV